MDTIAVDIETIVELSELAQSNATTAANVAPEPELQDETYYRPGEILFTFIDTTSRPDADGPRVQTLLQRIRDIAGVDLELIPPTPSSRSGRNGPHLAGAPLTLRFRVARRDGGETTRDHVKEAVDAVNATLHMLEHEGILVSSACPNWITSSGGWGHAIGGPATLADPAPTGSWSLQVPAGVDWPADQAATDRKVIVAVLDTSPGSAALAQAAAMARNKDNALMQDLARNNVIVDWNRFDAPDGIDTIRKPLGTGSWHLRLRHYPPHRATRGNSPAARARR